MINTNNVRVKVIITNTTNKITKTQGKKKSNQIVIGPGRPNSSISCPNSTLGPA